MAGILAIVVLIYNRIVNKSDNKYFSELNLNLKGEVISAHVISNSNGFGVVEIKIFSTNLKHYDPRNKHSFYYCLIKDSVAQVYESGARDISTGDTAEIDTKNRRFSLQSKTYGNRTWRIVLLKDASFYSHVEKKYQSFFNVGKIYKVAEQRQQHNMLLWIFVCVLVVAIGFWIMLPFLKTKTQ